MGNVCSGSRLQKGKARFRKRSVAEMRPEGTVYALVVALDYEGYGAAENGLGKLTCTPDCQRFIELGEQSGKLQAANYTYIKDSGRGKFPTAQAVLDELASFAGRVQAGDTFMFFYAGHGDQQFDWEFGEEDLQDEVLCTMAPDGSPDFLKDDDLAAALQAFDEEATIIVITDCCHSGSVCDLEAEGWGDRWVIHMAAVQDAQCAVDLGQGGAYTSAMLEGLQTMVAEEHEPPTCSEVYNMAQEHYGEEFQKYDQNFTFSYSPAADPDLVRWPFYPEGYEVETALDSW